MNRQLLPLVACLLLGLGGCRGYHSPFDAPGTIQQQRLSASVHDPYVDNDGDGWVSGPQYEAKGLTELLFLFKDPDDSASTVQPELPVDV